MASPNGTAALLHVINTPKRGVGPATRTRLLQRALRADSSIWELIRPRSSPLRLPGGRSPHVRRFAETIAKPRVQTARMNAGTFARELARHLDLEGGDLKSYTFEGLTRRERVARLMNRLDAFPGTPMGLVEALGGDSSTDDGTDAGAVGSIGSETGATYEPVYAPAWRKDYPAGQ